MKRVFVYLLSIFLTIHISCNKEEGVSAESKIISFSIESVNCVIDGNNIYGTLKDEGGEITSLAPQIEISEGATISPESGVETDFTNPVIYIVTAENKIDFTEYTVMISEEPSSEAEILSFEIEGCVLEIDTVSNTIMGVLRPGFGEITSLTPEIKISEGAIINPESGVATNFLNPVRYVVTAQDQSTKTEYTVAITKRDDVLGLYVENGALKKDGKLYYGMGANYFNLFYRTLLNNSDKSYVDGLTQLAQAGIPFVRFNAGGFYAGNWDLYKKDKEKYFELFDKIVSLSEELNIGLIPSVIWNFPTIPAMLGEDKSAYEDDNSATIDFVRTYTRELVKRYGDSPAILGWEFGNEFSLFVHIQGDNAFSYESMRNAFEEFSKEIRKYDATRIILTGNSEPRYSAYNNSTGYYGVADKEWQHKEMLLKYNPDLVNTITVRGYHNIKGTPEDPHAYEPLGLPVGEYFAKLKEWSVEAGKPLFVGEFGAQAEWIMEGDWNVVPSVREAYQERIDAIVNNEIPLSAFWVYDYSIQNNTPTWNIRFDNDRAYMIDIAIEANNKLEALIK